MSNHPRPNRKNRSAIKRTLAQTNRVSRFVPLVSRSRTQVSNSGGPFVPPEDWHEPSETAALDFEIVTQDPGPGYRHVVTAAEVRSRLEQLPEFMLEPLDVVQLSQMTKKKQRFPCYGMQWGAALYLYPLEESLVEHFGRPPKPAQKTEAQMFGGRWVQLSGGRWDLIWTEKTIRDFYLNNVLIHELGHLLDDRNSRYIDRERFAEWFAINYGYKATAGGRFVGRPTRRRHHRK